VANEWNKTAFVEFETMLRRHLRSGAGPVAACAGFDLDAASAYLEGALGGSHRANYESHLAGCAICRRHLIELSRLAQATPRFEARPAAAPDRIASWDRWKEAVAGWFDLSNWNLKWQMAGATGAVFAILIAALSVQLWRRAPNQAAVALNRSDANSQPAAELATQSFLSPTPESQLQAADAPVAQNPIAGFSDRSPIPAPAPLVGPVVGAPKVDVEARSDALALTVNQPSEAPVAAKPGGGGATAEAAQSLPPQPRTFVQLNELSMAEGLVGERLRYELKELAAKDRAPGSYITPPPFRASLVGSEPEPSAKQPLDRRSKLRAMSDIKLWMLPELVRRSLSPFSKSDSDTESERKTNSDKQTASDDGTPKPMQIMIRNKIFCFEKCKGPDLEKIRGMWIDREYDFEKQKWNIWTLTRDSEEYKRVLADEPLLKEFFDHGPILIVWKNRIYKVLK